jgi:hypothetical protein
MSESCKLKNINKIISLIFFEISRKFGSNLLWILIVEND